ncbi:lipoprotein [Nonomuraea antimicrobica]|uniref:Lipoprotein n=1 Tax=Nonomuraea antimicrobica TaxID=561173 RepID=A0ABP7CGE4_9ACTN
MKVWQYVIALAMAGLAAGCATGAPAQPQPKAEARTQAPATNDTPAPQVTESTPPGDIPDDTMFVIYRHPGQPYRVEVPEGWARTDLATGAGFTDKLNGIRIETKPATVPPTEASVRNQVQSDDIRTVNTVTRQGGKAVRIVYRADSSPDAVTGKVVKDEIERYIFHRSGLDAILTLSGPVGADNVDAWRTVSDSFRWTAP